MSNDIPDYMREFIAYCCNEWDVSERAVAEWFNYDLLEVKRIVSEDKIYDGSGLS